MEDIKKKDQQLIEVLESIIDAPVHWTALCSENQALVWRTAEKQMEVKEDAMKMLHNIKNNIVDLSKSE